DSSGEGDRFGHRHFGHADLGVGRTPVEAVFKRRVVELRLGATRYRGWVPDQTRRKLEFQLLGKLDGFFAAVLVQSERRRQLERVRASAGVRRTVLFFRDEGVFFNAERGRFRRDPDRLLDRRGRRAPTACADFVFERDFGPRGLLYFDFED